MKTPTSYRQLLLATLMAITFSATSALAQQASITIAANEVKHHITPYLTGACIEDVNHEIYGGIDSQLIFGESFAEPAAQFNLKGFTAFGGRWTTIEDGSVQGVGSDGSKIIWGGTPISDGEVSMDVKLTESNGGNAGLILKVKDAGRGADTFTGYEVSLERPGMLVLGRHRQNWEPLERVPCDVPVGEWINLRVRMTGNSLEIFVNSKSLMQYEDTTHPLEAGGVGLRIWQHKVFFRNLSVTSAGAEKSIPFEYDMGDHPLDSVSGMWRPIREGNVNGQFSLFSKEAFSGSQSQEISFESGTGAIGIENQSLNRWGMNFIVGKPYEGYLYVRAEKPTTFFVSLESRDGSKLYAEKPLKVNAGGWQKVDFTLSPRMADKAGRFAIKLKQSGKLSIGYAFLQPGAWGRFKGLPVRKDIGEGLVNQGITILRLGGGMANAADYRWKKMTGPRALRPPYEGSWYPYSSLGWGVFEFLNYCEAANIFGIPNLNINETPQDIADFIEYVNGPTSTKWGAKRAAEGHPKPYGLKHLQLGNEERVDDQYFAKFKSLAEAIWAKDPSIILIVGDFVYDNKIEDPFHFTGAGTRITTMAAHQKVLQLAKQYNAEVWFDVHINSDGPRPNFGGFFSYADALDKLANGAKHKLLTFEFNASNHTSRRALGNAGAIIQIARDGRMPVATSANCLQPDGQNDNGWDQGLLFLNPSQTWLQPPGYVTQMVARNYQPQVVKCDSGDSNIDVCATKSEDGKTLVLQIVNYSEQPLPAVLQLGGYTPPSPTARVEELSAPLTSVNTAVAPERIKPYIFTWTPAFKDGKAAYTLPPSSFTIIRFQ